MRFFLMLGFCVGCASSTPPPAPITEAPSTPPPAPVTCATVAASARYVFEPKDKADAVHDAVLAQCEADQWGDAARRCTAHADTTGKLSRCFEQLTEVQRARMEEALARATAESTIAQPSVAELPEGCKRYRAAVEWLARCHKLPPETKQALRDSFNETSQSWLTLPPDAFPALNTACIASAEAAEQAAAACK